MLGTFLVARELSEPRLALLAVFVVGTLPIVLNYSRKWDIQFHAACLVPFGLWLAIRALRDGRHRWWVAFGLWQGMRVYSHPIHLPDIAVTVALVGAARIAPAVLRRDVGEALRRAVPWAGAAAIVVAMSVWYTGFLGDLIGEPGYSLRQYLAARHSYTEGAWIQNASVLAVARLGADLVREVFWLHLMPGAAFLLLPGLLAIPGYVLRRPVNLTGWGIEWLLLLTVLAQVPPAGLAASNRAYINDWLFVFPTVVILALIALRAMRDRLMTERRRTLATKFWVAAAVLNGLWGGRSTGCSVPGGAGSRRRARALRGTPDRPVYSLDVRPAPRDPPHGCAAAPRTRGCGGPREGGRGRPASSRSRVCWISPGNPSRFGASGCRLGDPGHRAGWRFGRPDASAPGSEPTISPWPFAFEGFESVNLEAPPSDFAPSSLPRLVLVRLWLEPVVAWAGSRHRCVPANRLPEGFVGAAESIVRSRLGAQSEILSVTDPTGALVGRTIEWVPDPTYLGLTLWVDRGPGTTGDEVQPDDDT